MEYPVYLASKELGGHAAEDETQIDPQTKQVYDTMPPRQREMLDACYTQLMAMIPTFGVPGVVAFKNIDGYVFRLSSGDGHAPLDGTDPAIRVHINFPKFYEPGHESRCANAVICLKTAAKKLHREKPGTALPEEPASMPHDSARSIIFELDSLKQTLDTFTSERKR